MNKLSRASVFWFVAVLAMVVVFIGYSPNRDAGKAVSFAEFTSEVQQGRVGYLDSTRILFGLSIITLLL